MESRKGSIRKLLKGPQRASIDELPLWALSHGVSCLIIDLSAYESAGSQASCRGSGSIP